MVPFNRTTWAAAREVGPGRLPAPLGLLNQLPSIDGHVHLYTHDPHDPPLSGRSQQATSSRTRIMRPSGGGSTTPSGAPTSAQQLQQHFARAAAGSLTQQLRNSSPIEQQQWREAAAAAAAAAAAVSANSQPATLLNELTLNSLLSSYM